MITAEEDWEFSVYKTSNHLAIYWCQIFNSLWVNSEHSKYNSDVAIVNTSKLVEVEAMWKLDEKIVTC